MKTRKIMSGMLLAAALFAFSSQGIAAHQEEGPSDHQEVNSSELSAFPGRAAAVKIPLRLQDEKDASNPYAYFYKTWLSKEQFSTVPNTAFWAGEQVCGNNITKVLYGDATLDRYYQFEPYSVNEHFGPSTYPVGNHHFSWCLTIPINKAAGNSLHSFVFKTHVDEMDKTIIAKKSFKVRRYGYANATRAYFSGVSTSLGNQIRQSTSSAKTYLVNSSLRYTGLYRYYSTSAASFLADLRIYKPAAALIHSHGGETANGGVIQLKNGSVFGAAELAASGVNVPGGLFYAAVCEGATSDTLGNAFVAAGYDAYIGYTVSVYTTRNADFYKYFFERATHVNVSVQQALTETIQWANNQGWDDVATARIIGNGSALYLGEDIGAVPPLVLRSAEAEEGEETVEQPIVARHWTKVSSIQLNAAEQEAVKKASGIKGVKDAALEVPAAETDGNSGLGIEEFGKTYRISIKDGHRFVYGVDVDKVSGEIVAEGPLG